MAKTEKGHENGVIENILEDIICLFVNNILVDSNLYSYSIFIKFSKKCFFMRWNQMRGCP